MDFDKKKLSLALLVGAYKGTSNKHLCEEHLDELAALTHTSGINIANKIVCPLNKIERATYLRHGKIEELLAVVKELKIDVVIFDEDILPSQQRNLEKIFEIPVIDRTEVILDVFLQHAKTREAKLQIELAKTKYQLPRLKRLWTHLSRQRGGRQYLKGEGEKQIEIDKRLLKKQISKLQSELEEVRQQREVQRHARVRSGIPTFAIVGYTNAGKSTLLNALTDAEVLVEDKLFATLDTTTRKYTLPNNQDILLIDTVGFIRKIPHQLVASFKSTLEESVKADILIHLIDASHPMAVEQADEANKVLQELGAVDKPIITVFNKIDKCEDMQRIDQLRAEYVKTASISALHKTGFDLLMDIMIDEISKMRKLVNLRIPQSKYELVSEIMRTGNIINQEYEGNDILIRAEVPAAYLFHLQSFQV